MFILCSCQGQRVDTNVLHPLDSRLLSTASLVSIDNSLPLLHNNTRIHIVGDTLILQDWQSTTYQFYGYDILKDSVMGCFGIFGNGPGEIIHPDNAYFDIKNRIMYVQESSSWVTKGFNLMEALCDSSYLAFTKVMEDTTYNSMSIPHDMHYVSDSCVICARYVPNDDWTQLNYTLGRYSLHDGVTRQLGSLSPEPRTRGHIGVFVHDSLIVEASSTHDRIRLYDFEGHLNLEIKGQNYNKRYDGRTLYYGHVVACEGLIFICYSGRDASDHRYGNWVVVLDSKGSHIHTIEFEDHITSMDYYSPLKRLYVSTDGLPQFGYVEISDIN